MADGQFKSCELARETGRGNRLGLAKPTRKYE
jgi:hypothetical protein